MTFVVNMVIILTISLVVRMSRRFFVVNFWFVFVSRLYTKFGHAVPPPPAHGRCRVLLGVHSIKHYAVPKHVKQERANLLATTRRACGGATRNRASRVSTRQLQEDATAARAKTEYEAGAKCWRRSDDHKRKGKCTCRGTVRSRPTTTADGTRRRGRHAWRTRGPASTNRKAVLREVLGDKRVQRLRIQQRGRRRVLAQAH